jgi:hypothetical protein
MFFGFAKVLSLQNKTWVRKSQSHKLSHLWKVRKSNKFCNSARWRIYNLQKLFVGCPSLLTSDSLQEFAFFRKKKMYYLPKDFLKECIFFNILQHT